MIYGLMRTDLVIIAANALSLALLSCIIFFKLREKAPDEAGRQRAA